MPYQVRAIHVHDEPTAVENIRSEVVLQTSSLRDAMAEARMTRDRLAAAPEDGVHAVVEVVDWEQNSVLWRAAIGEDDQQEDERIVSD
jgi:hypothetical protein